eukprot:PhF_6_TR1539/c0_g1_i1/m.2811
MRPKMNYRREYHKGVRQLVCVTLFLFSALVVFFMPEKPEKVGASPTSASTGTVSLGADGGKVLTREPGGDARYPSLVDSFTVPTTTLPNTEVPADTTPPTETLIPSNGVDTTSQPVTGESINTLVPLEVQSTSVNKRLTQEVAGQTIEPGMSSQSGSFPTFAKSFESGETSAVTEESNSTTDPSKATEAPDVEPTKKPKATEAPDVEPTKKPKATE